MNGRLNPLSVRLEPEARDECLKKLGSAIGQRYSMAMLSNFEIYEDSQQRPVVERLKRFADAMPDCMAGGAGLILFGPPGTGKDHLLAALLKIAVVKHRLSVLWFDGQELFEEARHAIRKEKEHEFRNRMMVPHVLAISDPQPPKGELSDYQTGLIRDVIDRRYRRGLPTWITTNMDNADDANRLLTEPVMQRLREASGKVFCDWPSYRERQKSNW